MISFSDRELCGEVASQTHCIVGRFARRVRHAAEEVESDVLKQRTGHPVQHEQDENGGESVVIPTHRMSRWVGAVVVADPHDLPNPGCHQTRADACEADESSFAARPGFVVQDLLQPIAGGDLQHDGTEGEEAPRP